MGELAGRSAGALWRLSARTGVEILILSSSPEVAKRLQESLGRQGHRVRVSAGVSEALPLLEGQRVDLLVADCQQLALNGAALFRSLARCPQPPMILPLVPQPPGSMAPLPAHEVERLQAVAAQAQGLLSQRNEETLQIGELIIDPAGKRVTFRGQRVTMPPIQFRLLAYLAQHAGRVVGAQELLRAVWGYEGEETEARELVKVHVRQIRRRLGLEAQHPDYVQSVRGFGYVVRAPGTDPY